jgi:hypothetical protein
MQSRPDFVTALLERPLPQLQPPKLSNTNNTPYSISIRSSIADARLHPLLESVLHLMNDDLFSAHFLLRKMQEVDWAKWLHGILHAREGDMCNSKCWYRDTPAKLLRLVYATDSSKDDAHSLASHALDHFSLALGRTPSIIRENTVESRLAIEAGKAYTEAELEDLTHSRTLDDFEKKSRQDCWDELRAILHQLEEAYGWGEVDGTQVYTKDSQETKDKDRVLGEGWRTF